MKTALVYDRINKWGGAERVLLALHELFPKADLFTSVYNHSSAKWASVFNIKTSFLQRLPCASSLHEFYAMLMPIAFESFNFDGYDLVISITSESAKGIITKPSTRHICYCLTPTRYLWSGYDEYFKDSFLRSFSSPAISYLRKWDRVASHRPDKYIAISKEIANRIETFYGEKSYVIYPPVGLIGTKSSRNKNDKGYFLIVSRLVAYKKIDLAIQACNELNLKLIIVGKGAEEKKLKKIAGPNITFLGEVTDEELIKYYEESRGFIYPAHEDFGIAVVEAQRYGKPVVAYRGGGAIETVVHEKTGLLFSPQTKEALIAALERFKSLSFDPTHAREQAQKFSTDQFKKEFLDVIKDQL